MTKREQMNANYDKVAKRLGKTTGVSKGKAKLPKPKIKPKLNKKGGGVKITFTL